MQGTYVEGVKEEVVLSPAHALSIIAAGEGNVNFKQKRKFMNVHVPKDVFTLPIRRSPRGIKQLQYV